MNEDVFVYRCMTFTEESFELIKLFGGLCSGLVTLSYLIAKAEIHKENEIKNYKYIGEHFFPNFSRNLKP